MKIWQLLLMLGMCFSCIVAAEETIVTKNVTGVGRSYRGAINAGLIMAVEQNCGLTISSTQRVNLTESELSVSSTKLGEEDKLHITDEVREDMKKWCQGRILGYNVISDSYDDNTHQYIVQLDVQFYGRYVVGLDPNARRRMVVAPFASNVSSIDFMGTRLSTRKWLGDLARSLNVHLTQTRKFTMLDRQFDDEVNKELARATDGNASSADFAPRLNQKLATDYLVVGKVLFRNVAQPLRDPYTMQIVPNQELPMAEVHYRVLLAPTGQLKWTNTLKVNVMDALGTAGTGIEDIMSATAENVATKISDEILSSILPFEIVAVTKNGTIVIGEGGKSLGIGEQLVVYALGETVKDTRTGEVLDEIEEEIGVIEITRVTEKMSYARLVSGDISKIAVGSRVRRPENVNVQAAPAAAPSTLTPNANGGVVAPF